MRNYMKITRRQVLLALKYEPLTTDQFVNRHDTDNPKCEVCAVGGTLRRAGLSNNEIRRAGIELIHAANVAGGEDDIEHQLENELYLHALSSFYEMTAEEHTIEDTRLIVSEWAKANLPVTFNADI